MKMRSAWALVALATAAAAAAAPAATQSRNLYGVVGVGRSTLDVDGNDVDRFARSNGLATSTTFAESDDWGGKIQLGWTLSDTFAIEGGYINLGTAAFITTNNLYTRRGTRRPISSISFSSAESR